MRCIELEDSRKPNALKGQHRKIDVLFMVQSSEVLESSEVFND